MAAVRTLGSKAMPGHFNVEQIDWADWVKTIAAGGGLAWLFGRRGAKAKEKGDTRTADQKSIEILQGSVKELNEKVEGNTSRIDALEHERHNLLDQIIGHKQEIAELKLEIADLKYQKVRAEQNDVMQAATIAELNVRLAAAKGELHSAERQLASLTEKINY